jgi:hypothetical protein
MYNVGQGDNLLSAGKVAYPKYENGTITGKEYPCSYILPDHKKRPVSIPLGTYEDPYNEYGYVENYVEDTQQTRSGELSDRLILIIMITLLVVFSVCTYMAFQDKM